MKYKTSENHKAIQEICRKADAAGMTYGKYVARYGGRIKPKPKPAVEVQMPHNAKAVKQTDEQGNVIREFASVGECVRATGMSDTAIRTRCHGKITAPAKDGCWYAWAE